MGRDTGFEDSKYHRQHEGVKSGFQGIPEAPIYYPTEEEFKDPLKYIEKIRKEAETYGICKIVPPKQWNPPFTIDRKNFTFPTKLQAIHHLQMRPAAHDADTFKLEYTRYLKNQGHAVYKWPSFRGKDLDLCQFFSAVKRHGGYQKVTKDKKWGEVLQILDPSFMLTSQSESLQTMLREMYETHLYDYEAHLSKLTNRKRHRSATGQEMKNTLKERKLRRLNLGESTCSEKECKEDDGESSDHMCEQCHSGSHEQSMLFCDRCNQGWHLYCLTPPLSSAPSGNWYCSDCISSDKDSFGFTTGQVHNFESFRQAAKRFKKRWFGGRKDVSYSEVEEEFWSVVERCKGPVEVLYGSDLPTEVYGSGFPRSLDRIPPSADKSVWNEYVTSPWNLNNFPKLPGSVLKHVQENIPGVTVPWVYMGMLFSAFCWHYEDQCLYSINYLHWGEPKCWYGVPGSAVDAFEEVMHKSFPDLFEAQPDLLFQLVTMLNPKVLRENDVPVYNTIQERGNFVITFPRSYHGGFNLGLNCAEAVNFATLDWLPFGRFGVERCRLYHKAVVLSQEELLCVVAKDAQSYGRSSFWLKKEFDDMISRERRQRMALWQNGIVHSSRMLPRKFPEAIGTEEDPVCVICQYYCFISAITCGCCPGRVVCLEHSEHLCECSRDQQELLYRYSLAELDELQCQLPTDCSDIVNDESCGKQRKCSRELNAVLVDQNLDYIKQAKMAATNHVKLAERWCLKTNVILHSTPKLLDVEDLLQEAEQFLWAGHEVNNVRLIEKKLQSIRGWAQGVVDCLATSGMKHEDEEISGRVTLATAQDLLCVNPAPCDLEKSLSKLKGLVELTSSMQKKLQTLFTSRTQLELTELEEFREMLIASPFSFPEAKKLGELINATYVWRKKVHSLFLEPRMHWVSGQKNGTNMETLHSLQAEAGKLSVILPEKKILDAYVCKLEKWQERAKQLLDATVPLQDVQEILLEIDSVPVYFEEAEILERRTFEVKEWIRSVHKVIADVQQQRYYAASMALLSALIQSGKLLKIKVGELDELVLEFKRVSWLDKATKGLKSQLTRIELLDILEEARSLSLENEEVYIELHQVVEDARVWESKASQILEDGASIDEFEALRRDSSKISITLAGCVDINLQLVRAQSFLYHAQAFINPSSINSEAAPCFETLQELVENLQSLKIRLPEKMNLISLFENVQSWKKKAEALMKYAEQMLRETNLMDQFHVKITIDQSISATTDLLMDLGSIMNEGQALGVKISEKETLSQLISATEWSIGFSKLVLSHPSIEELQNHLQGVGSLGDHFGQLQQLQFFVRMGREWFLKLKNSLQPEVPELKCSVYDLEDLLVEAKQMGISIFSDVAHLEELLDIHKTWQTRISKFLLSPINSISWEELHQIQEIGKSSQIRFDDFELLEIEVGKVEAWLLKCRQNLLGQSELSSKPFLEVLLKVQTSVHNALRELQKRAYIEGNHFNIEDGECHLCKENVDNTSYDHIKCDNCNDRYHRSCLGLEDHYDWNQNQFVCSFCNAFNAGVLWFDEGVLLKICVTKRPTLIGLEDLLGAAEGIQFRMKEIELLKDIVEAMQEWENCLQQLVDPILRSHSTQCFSTSPLLSALKIAGTMEVQGDGKGQLALALCVNAWRMHAKSIMEGSTKPSYRTLCRILREGLAIPCLVHDSVLKDLKTWETMASVWFSQAKMAMEDDGDMPLEDVYKLIIEGEKLPVAFTKELADLRSRTSLYCVCRKPYDKERRMIACDLCSEWYHFDCMGISGPDSNDDEGSNMLQRCGSSRGEFVCPNCKDVVVADAADLFVQLQDMGDPRKDDAPCVESALYTPPLWYARGKRSSRMPIKVRADLQERWQNHSNLLYQSRPLPKEADSGDSATVVSASGRPCRRTAGQNSRFESFVLLMHSG
ncbi:hypothetical protein KP509_01G024900 [Ceratopteris richardii]|uniref:[Histone H3]-trimethyl-L-lysine(4) demethylase n=1 Tax=Ceratopteris richardii TaxID=49495 RepID=A0A8T2VF15_CERRI|nr:hypothetical protein KP509_01G024900 [Ceratopteris richardii]KAH7445801.1 hypothetical protein KP509_01G024900 [Ceratopteris richardii]KAH7445808.1 hypothetical protein KP509_01G024900 [Ceratopteris richardii]